MSYICDWPKCRERGCGQPLMTCEYWDRRPTLEPRNERRAHAELVRSTWGGRQGRPLPDEESTGEPLTFAERRILRWSAIALLALWAGLAVVVLL